MNKIEKKGRTAAELNEVLYWLTGYKPAELETQINNGCDLETFFSMAPGFNNNASKIKGTVCGCKVEEIENKLMQKIRYMDKLVDDLSKGKEINKILFREK